MTSDNPSTSQQSDNYKAKTLYLKESLRLSELLIEQQDMSFTIIERKTVLLVTLYIAITAYMLSWGELYKENKIIIISLIFIFIIFVIAIGVGLLALYTRKFIMPGAKPKYLLHKYFNYDFNKMAEDLLNNHYDKIFEPNNKAHEKKRKYFKISLWLGVGNIVLTCLCIIANLVTQVF